MANENPGLAVVQDRISELTKEIECLEQSISSQKEDVSVSSLEQWVFQLKCSIIDVSLKIPEIATFDRHFNRLDSKGAILYIIDLLHQCWMYANPTSLLSTPIKNLGQEELLDIALSKYSSQDSPQGNLDTIYDKNPRAAVIRYAQDKRDRRIYGDILENIRTHCGSICEKHGIGLTENFLTRPMLKSSHNASQLSAVFDILVNKGYVLPEDRQNFISIFSCSLTAQESPVRWMAKSVKNDELNYAVLYMLFSTLGFTMEETERNIIAATFVQPNGKALKPESLKKRKESQVLLDLRNNVLKALSR